MKLPQTTPLLLASLSGGLSLAAPYNGTLPNSTAPMFPMSADEEFSFIVSEILALSNGGGAATGEVLRAASQITPGSYESWYQEFNWLGQHVHDLALSAKSAVSRRGALFRSSSYNRMSSFFFVGNPNDDRLYTTWDRAIDDFHEAISLLPVPGEIFTVKSSSSSASTRNHSSSHFEIPGYFFKASPSNSTKLPTIVVGSGYDAAQEDSWHALGQQALDRGYNFVTYEGPGQPTVRRNQDLGFIPQWWEAVTPVVDWLEREHSEDVDMDNLALIGISFGGQLAPLAASREHRFKAVLSIDGLVDMQAATLGQFPQELQAIFHSGNKTEFDAIMTKGLAATDSTLFKWFAAQGLWSFETESYYDWLVQLGEFKLTQEIVNNVTAKPWVGKGNDDTLVGGVQEGVLRDMYKKAGNEAEFKVFATELGAGEHCQLGAEPYLAEAAFDWLQGVFGV